MAKRELEIVLISDTHLGTYGCHAEELLRYLKSVRPKKLILNGDIIDIWAFRKSFFPKSHMDVIRQIMKMIGNGVEVHYLPGNHDDLLRRFTEFHLGDFHLEDKMLIELNGKTTWIFHGDVFDHTITKTPWLAKIGGKGYDLLILFNRFINRMLKSMGKPKVSLSKRIKKSVKQAVKFIGDFEETAANLAIDNKYDYVICGHIHQVQDRIITNKKGSVHYLNSGDWIENLTALEFNAGCWEIYRYELDPSMKKGKTTLVQADN